MANGRRGAHRLRFFETLKNNLMSFDAIGSAMMILFDELKDDKKSEKLIEQMDSADSDAVLKKGIKAGIKRLRAIGKNALADDLEKKTKGFI